MIYGTSDSINVFITVSSIDVTIHCNAMSFDKVCFVRDAHARKHNFPFSFLHSLFRNSDWFLGYISAEWLMISKVKSNNGSQKADSKL